MAWAWDHPGVILGATENQIPLNLGDVVRMKQAGQVNLRSTELLYNAPDEDPIHRKTTQTSPCAQRMGMEKNMIRGTARHEISARALGP